MSIALRDEDRELALVVRAKSTLWHPERALKKTYGVWWACIGQEIGRLHLRVHTGFLADNMTARAMAWTRRDIAIGDGLERAPLRERCPAYTEETRHALEIPFWNGRFQGAYVFSPRARWPIEMQPSIAIVRWYRVLGTSRAVVYAFAERRAAAFARPFPGYNLGRIRDLRRETTGLLMAVFDGKA